MNFRESSGAVRIERNRFSVQHGQIGWMIKKEYFIHTIFRRNINNSIIKRFPRTWQFNAQLGVTL